MFLRKPQRNVTGHVSSVCPGGEIEPGSPGLNVHQEGRPCKGPVAGEAPRVGAGAATAGEQGSGGSWRGRRQVAEARVPGPWLCGWGLGVNPKCDLAADFPTQLSVQLVSL